MLLIKIAHGLQQQQLFLPRQRPQPLRVGAAAAAAKAAAVLARDGAIENAQHRGRDRVGGGRGLQAGEGLLDPARLAVERDRHDQHDQHDQRQEEQQQQGGEEAPRRRGGAAGERGATSAARRDVGVAPAHPEKINVPFPFFRGAGRGGRGSEARRRRELFDRPAFFFSPDRSVYRWLIDTLTVLLVPACTRALSRQ